jgi:Domain of unknown function (DUF6968)
MSKKLTGIMAERKGTLRLSDGSLRKVRVLVGKPARRRGEQDYICRFQVIGLADDGIRSIVGYDSLQAIELALRFLGHVIESSTPPGSVWEDASENLGFPRHTGAK